ncbi:MAG: hypothetical protein LBT64_02920 [Puniceicoccales bacterium]|jgi:hypothetical protein|nr:hypothetical protein [Puniceicoccales bacterium]
MNISIGGNVVEPNASSLLKTTDGKSIEIGANDSPGFKDNAVGNHLFNLIGNTHVDLRTLGKIQAEVKAHTDAADEFHSKAIAYTQAGMFEEAAKEYSAAAGEFLSAANTTGIGAEQLPELYNRASNMHMAAADALFIVVKIDGNSSLLRRACAMHLAAANALYEAANNKRIDAGQRKEFSNRAANMRMELSERATNMHMNPREVNEMLEPKKPEEYKFKTPLTD